MNFPGGIVKFTPELKFLSDVPEERIHCYRVLNESGQLLTSDFVEVCCLTMCISPKICNLIAFVSYFYVHQCNQIDEEIAVKMYKEMVMLQTVDTIFYEAQRQGRISFYVTTTGEEAINIASAAALSMDDFVFPQVNIPYVTHLYFIFKYT